RDRNNQGKRHRLVVKQEVIGERLQILRNAARQINEGGSLLGQVGWPCAIQSLRLAEAYLSSSRAVIIL
ncbi:MAG: hypothetical protein K0M47_17320, partial [Rhizobium sp.]|nr:hypothetical protein [Rhizobium sp.]